MNTKQNNLHIMKNTLSQSLNKRVTAVSVFWNFARAEVIPSLENDVTVCRKVVAERLHQSGTFTPVMTLYKDELLSNPLQAGDVIEVPNFVFVSVSLQLHPSNTQFYVQVRQRVCNYIFIQQSSVALRQRSDLFPRRVKLLPVQLLPYIVLFMLSAICKELQIPIFSYSIWPDGESNPSL